METYGWHQDSEKVVVDAPIPPRIKAKDVAFELTPTALTLGVKGQPPLIDRRSLASTVKPDDSLWMIEEIPGEGRCVRVTMCKCVSREWEFLLKKDDPSASRPTPHCTSNMDDSILAKFPDDDHALGPFLGNLPNEILDVVVKNLGWFQTTFAMAGKTCRKAVERVSSTRAELTEEERSLVKDRERKGFEMEDLLEDLKVLHGLHRDKEWPDTTPFDVAVVEADVEALKWLIQLFDGKGLNWCDVSKAWKVGKTEDDGGLDWRNERLTWLAAKRGKIESLMCLHANGCPWNEKTCSAAAEGGYLDVLQWAQRNECPWDSMTCANAAKEGHLDVLQWARLSGCPWNAGTCANAAWRGHLEVLKWAHENGCPWNDVFNDTCMYAASGGHLEVLKWARENGCPWDQFTCTKAAERGDLKMLQWARQNGCPWDDNTTAFAAREGRLEVLQWLREYECPCDERVCRLSAQRGHLNVLRWAHENGCPWDEGTWDTAHKRCRPYLEEHECPVPDYDDDDDDFW